MTVKIEIPETLNSRRGNWTHRIVLVPATLRVEVWSMYGDGVPADIWHGRATRLGQIPDGTADTSPYVEALEALEDELLELASLHGVTWDGHNHVGHYTEPDRATDLVREIREAIRQVEAPSYQDAGDWLHGCAWGDLVPEGFDGSDAAFASASKEIEDGAIRDGVHLTGTEECLRDRWEREQEDAD